MCCGPSSFGTRDRSAYGDDNLQQEPQQNEMAHDYTDHQAVDLGNKYGTWQEIPIFPRLSLPTAEISRKSVNRPLFNRNDSRSTIKRRTEMERELRVFEEAFGPSRILLEKNDTFFLDGIFDVRNDPRTIETLAAGKRRLVPRCLVGRTDIADPLEGIVKDLVLWPHQPTCKVSYTRKGMPIYEVNAFMEYVPVAERGAQIYYARWNSLDKTSHLGGVFFNPAYNAFTSANVIHTLDLTDNLE